MRAGSAKAPFGSMVISMLAGSIDFTCHLLSKLALISSRVSADHASLASSLFEWARQSKGTRQPSLINQKCKEGLGVKG